LLSCLSGRSFATIGADIPTIGTLLFPSAGLPYWGNGLFALGLLSQERRSSMEALCR
jgi:hypothetical protein